MRFDFFGSKVFSLLGIKVLHGWIPEDVETQSVLDSMTYNEASELLAVADSLEMESEMKHDNNISSEHVQLLQKAAVIRRFFESSSSQLTYEGLFQIHAELKEGELAVLFRNNHFSTVYLHESRLYTLVTDIGYMHKSNAVWETLESMDGDTEMVNAKFEKAIGMAPAAADFNLVPDTDAAMAAQMQAESDAVLARSLQQQEDQKKPVGQLRPQGRDAHGREVFVDDLGRRFIKSSEPAPKRSPRKKPGRSSLMDDDGFETESSEEESKCVCM